MSMPTSKIPKSKSFATLFECLEEIHVPRRSGKIKLLNIQIEIILVNCFVKTIDLPPLRPVQLELIIV